MRRLAIVCIALANILGGLTYLGQDLALEGLPFGTITLGRNMVGLATMGLWLSLTGGIRWRYTPRELGRLTLIGVMAFAMPLLLGTVGVEWSTAANGSILILLEPASILLFSWLLLREHIRRLQVVGILVGLLGALVIVLRDAPVDGLMASEHLRGNIMLLLHAVLWGLYSPLMRPLAQRHRPMDVTFMSMLLAQILLVPAALVEVSEWRAGPELVPALGWTVALGLFGSFAATVLWNVSLKTLHASTVAPFVFLQPLAGVLGDTLARDRPVTPAALLGGAFIAAGVLLVIVRPRRPPMPGPPIVDPDPPA